MYSGIAGYISIAMLMEQQKVGSLFDRWSSHDGVDVTPHSPAIKDAMDNFATTT